MDQEIVELKIVFALMLIMFAIYFAGDLLCWLNA